MINYPTYENFINERKVYFDVNHIGRSENITQHNFLNLYEKNCVFIKNNDFLFRGLNYDAGDFVYVNPKSKETSERSTPSIYMYLLDLSKSWDKYPKRTYSIYLSKNINNALNYTNGKTENLYIVLPYVDNRLAICSTSDFFDSFSEVVNGSVSRFNESFKYFYKSVTNKNVTADNLAVFKQEMKILDDNKPYDISIRRDIINAVNFGDSLTKQYTNFINNWVKKGLDFVDVIGNYITPQKMKMKLQTYQTLKLPKDAPNEIYTDSECLMIRKSVFDKLKSETTFFSIQ